MNMKRPTASFSMTVLIGLALLSAVAHAQDPLPSWSDGKKHHRPFSNTDPHVPC